MKIVKRMAVLKCPECYFENENDAKFCIRCGYKIPEESPFTKLGAAEQKQKKTFKKGYVILPLILISTMIIYLLLSSYLLSPKTPATKSEEIQQPLKEALPSLPPEPATKPSPPPAPEPPPLTERPQRPAANERHETIIRYLKLGRAFYEDGNYDKAVEIFNRVLKIDQNNEEALNGIRKAEEARESRYTKGH
ncbi:MAG: zinc-ribbon domain-containing protein [Nitrospira sp.]|nr:zinc-ribbon domain-containing protein [Nitrospira sp.]